MLIVKSQYKIAKRLGAGVFDKTQTQKFALSEARSKGSRGRTPRRGGSDFGRQLLEKQRVRYTYGLSERQLSSYVEKASHASKPSAELYRLLEMRLDNAVYRTGLSPTRRAARQAVSHGHIVVNDRRSTIPSHNLKKGDVIRVRDGARVSPLYAGLADTRAEERRSIPPWLEFDVNILQATVTGEPTYSLAETGLDFSVVFEFYSR